MKVEISRRKFLQGTVALTVLGGTTLSGADVLAKSAEKEKLSGNRKIPTVCEMCVNKCAAIAQVEDGIVKKLDPNPYFPKSRNMLCARGVAGIKALYDPDRLTRSSMRRRIIAPVSDTAQEKGWLNIHLNRSCNKR